MNIPPDASPRFVTCPCQYCNGGIEFDASDLQKGETCSVQCSHCLLETIIFVPPSIAPPPVSPPAQAQAVDTPMNKRAQIVRNTTSPGAGCLMQGIGLLLCLTIVGKKGYL
jgi:hypothetical protein